METFHKVAWEQAGYQNNQQQNIQQLQAHKSDLAREFQPNQQQQQVLNLQQQPPLVGFNTLQNISNDYLQQQQQQQQQAVMGSYPQSYNNTLILDGSSGLQSYPTNILNGNQYQIMNQYPNYSLHSGVAHDNYQNLQFPIRENFYASTLVNPVPSFPTQLSNSSSVSGSMFYAGNSGITIQGDNTGSLDNDTANNISVPNLPISYSQPLLQGTNNNQILSYNSNNYSLIPTTTPPPSSDFSQPLEINGHKRSLPISFPQQLPEQLKSDGTTIPQGKATLPVKLTKKKKSTVKTVKPSEFPCPQCPKIFQKSYNLKSHMKIHSDERPFSCKHCQRSFARNHDRKRHELLHENVRKYTCGSLTPIATQSSIDTNGHTDMYDQNTNILRWGCGKKFSRVDGLVRHYKTEMGFVCVKPLLQHIKIMYMNNPNGMNNALGLNGTGVDPKIWSDYQELLANLGVQMIYDLINRMDSYAALL